MAFSHPPQQTDDADRDQSRPADERAEDLLALLTADYTQAILGQIRHTPEPARALADACDASRTTIYRRLNRLEDAGFVESRMTCDPDGHHRTVFETTLETITVEVRDDGYAISVDTGASELDSSQVPLPQPSD